MASEHRVTRSKNRPWRVKFGCRRGVKDPREIIGTTALEQRTRPRRATPAACRLSGFTGQKVEGRDVRNRDVRKRGGRSQGSRRSTENGVPRSTPTRAALTSPPLSPLQPPPQPPPRKARGFGNRAINSLGAPCMRLTNNTMAPETRWKVSPTSVPRMSDGF